MQRKVALAVLTIFLTGICHGMALAQNAGQGQNEKSLKKLEQREIYRKTVETKSKTGHQKQLQVKKIPAEFKDVQSDWSREEVLEARVKELKVILAHASVVESIGKNGSVGISSRVLVKDLEEAVEDEYISVGAAESSPSEGRISYESCVGSALMGTKVGDVVSVEVPGGIVRYEVLKVS